MTRVTAKPDMSTEHRRPLKMGRRAVTLLAAVVIAATASGLAGCKPRGIIVISRERNEALPILKHYNGSDPALTYPTVLLINSPEELAELGSTELATHLVDFNNESLLLLALGEKPTTGYWARINGVQRKGEHLYVQGTANRPAEFEPVTQVLTYPYSAVVIKKQYIRKIRSEIESVSGYAAAQQK